MNDSFTGVQIYAVMPARDYRSYFERRAANQPIDIDASLDRCEERLTALLEESYPGARILVRRQDHPTPDPPLTRVETTNPALTSSVVEQDVIDLIAEFDFTACAVSR